MELQQNANPESMMERVTEAGLMPIVVFGILSIVFGIVLALLLPALNVLPAQASVQAERTDALFTVLMGIGGIVFFLVQGLIYYAAIRFRAKPNDTSDGPSIHGNTMIEIVWTIIPAIIVVVLAIFSFITWQRNTAPFETPNMINGASVDTTAYGARFAWSFEYFTDETDINGEPISLSTDELHVYVGQDVELDMQTRDVIHSFWVPEMRVKQDLLPGRITTVRFSPIDAGEGWEFAGAYTPVTIYATADDSSDVVFSMGSQVEAESDVEQQVRLELVDPHAELGADWVEVIAPNGETGYIARDAVTGRYNRYRLICTELCGGGHGNMYSWLVIHENEAAMRSTWWDTQIADATIPPDSLIARGENAIINGGYGCAGCHLLDGYDQFVGVIGPNLSGIGSRSADSAAQAGLENGADYLAHSIRYPGDYLVAGYQNQMTQFSPALMPQEDLDAIVAFLCAQTTSGDPNDSTCDLPEWDVEDGENLVNQQAVQEALSAITDAYE